jgi:hypothetical protein
MLIRLLQVVLAPVIRTLGIGILRLGHMNRDKLELAPRLFRPSHWQSRILKAECDVALDGFAFTRGSSI